MISSTNRPTILAHLNPLTHTIELCGNNCDRVTGYVHRTRVMLDKTHNRNCVVVYLAVANPQVTVSNLELC